MEENPNTIYIKKTEDKLGKKTYNFLKPGEHKERHIVEVCMWVFLALLVGFSVPYFLVDVTMTLIKGNVDAVGTKIAEIIPRLNSEDEIAYGSNDSNKDKIPVSGTPDGSYYFLNANYVIPRTNGNAYVVADVVTGEVIIEKNPEAVYPIASISKLITALVSKEYLDQHSYVTISRSSIDTYGSSGGLYAGEKILVNDLFYPLLIESSNDAAEVLAQAKERDTFMKKMNEKAKDLGMLKTSFFEPSGLSEKNVSTARDLLKLAMYIEKEKPELWDITRIRQYAILKHYWANGNRLMQRSNFIGGKNGFTYEAHNTTISVFDVTLEGGKRKIAVSLLQSDDRDGDVDKLLKFVSRWVGFLPEGADIEIK